MFVVPHRASPHRRWLAHLLRAAEGGVRHGDPFDDSFAFDEGAVLRLALQQRVAPLLHRGLVDGRIGDPLPASFRDACERVYYAALRKNVVALDVGEGLLEALVQAGIEVAPLKGWAHLEGSVDGGDPLYPDPGVRPMDDLDFMVRPEAREAAAAVLAELGFQRVTASPLATRGGHELAFHRRTADIDVFAELHWAWAGPESLMRGFAVSGDRFLDELCASRRGGALAPTWLGHLLFAAVHAGRHALGRWIWLVDVHRLMLRPGLDWRALADAAARWRVCGPLYAALAASRELLRTPVPKELLARLAPGPMRRRLLHRTLAATTRDPHSTRAAWAAKALLGETWWDVARTAAWAVAPGEAWYEGRGLRATASRRITHPLRALAPTAQGGERE